MARTIKTSGGGEGGSKDESTLTKTLVIEKTIFLF